MRVLLSLIVSVVALVGCSNPREAANREARSLNQGLRETAFQNTREVQLDTRIFRVAVLEQGGYGVRATDISLSEFVIVRTETPFALVRLEHPVSAGYTGRDLQAVAGSATGCRASFDGGVLAFLGGFNSETTNLAEIEASRAADFEGWQVNLTC